MSNAVLKGLRFADTQESCFEAWKSSHLACSAHLCGRFVDSQKSHFQTLGRPYLGRGDPEGGRSADFPNYVFKLQNVLIWTVSKCKWVYLLIV